MFYFLFAISVAEVRSKRLLNAKRAYNAFMKENAHFFISRFPFPPFPISISSFLVLPVPGKYSNGELFVQSQIFIDDIIVWQVACELLKKTLRYGLEHSIGNPHTESGFVPMNTDEGV